MVLDHGVIVDLHADLSADVKLSGAISVGAPGGVEHGVVVEFITGGIMSRVYQGVKDGVTVEVDAPVVEVDDLAIVDDDIASSADMNAPPGFEVGFRDILPVEGDTGDGLVTVGVPVGTEGKQGGPLSGDVTEDDGGGGAIPFKAYPDSEIGLLCFGISTSQNMNDVTGSGNGGSGFEQGFPGIGDGSGTRCIITRRTDVIGGGIGKAT